MCVWGRLEVGVCDARAKWSCGVVWGRPGGATHLLYSNLQSWQAFQLWTPKYTFYILDASCILLPMNIAIPQLTIKECSFDGGDCDEINVSGNVQDLIGDGYCLHEL